MPKRSKCLPCLGQDIKAILLKELTGLGPVLQKIADCPEPKGIEFCLSHRGQSKYNIFISTCMKAKGIHGRAEAAQAMKTCASEWRGKHG